jgi:RimJ/RimL family protein N-acetyltransferase
LGLIRYDRITSDTASISFQIDYPYRGQGLGTLLLQLTAPRACQELQVSTLEGTTFATNEPSARAFLKAGFNLSREIVENNIPCRIFTWSQTTANP